MPTKVTDDQVRAALRLTGGKRAAAADLLGISERQMCTRAKRVEMEDRLASGPVMPAVPEGHRVRGVSTLSKIIDPETGQPVLQWIKTAEKAKEREQAARQALEALKDKIPRAGSVSPPRRAEALDDDLLALMVVTDYHLGMLAWGFETRGDDWDIEIAEDLLIRWFQLAIQQAPPAKKVVLAQLGDFLHYDSLIAETPTNRHILDSDTRPAKMVRTAIRVLRRVVGMLLKRFGEVHIIHAEGNHDPMSSIWLRETFAVFYEDEPRVTVDLSADPFYCVRHGDVSLFFHHGHKAKPEVVGPSFVRKFRSMYGDTRFSYAHLGHMHHLKQLETFLMKVEQHPTLAASDAFASRLGLESDRIAKVITYHREYGWIGEHGLSPAMVRALTPAA